MIEHSKRGPLWLIRARADNGRDGALAARRVHGRAPASRRQRRTVGRVGRHIRARHRAGRAPRVRRATRPDPAQLERHLKSPAPRGPGARLRVRRRARAGVGAFRPRVPAGALPRRRGDRSLGRGARSGRRALRASCSVCRSATARDIRTSSISTAAAAWRRGCAPCSRSVTWTGPARRRRLAPLPEDESPAALRARHRSRPSTRGSWACCAPRSRPRWAGSTRAGACGSPATMRKG